MNSKLNLERRGINSFAPHSFLFNLRIRKFKHCKTDAVVIRILTDVSAMLPSSGYTRLNTVRSSLNLGHAIDRILARVQHGIALYGA